MGFLVGIIFIIILCWGIKNGSKSSSSGVKTYRRKSGVLSGRR